MKPESALLWWWLNILTKRRYDLLRAKFGDLDAALHALTPELLKELGLRDESVELAFHRLESFDPAAILAICAKKGIEMLTMEDDAYPALLGEIPDAPVCLSYIGTLDLLRDPLIAIVGTRAMSQYGERVVERFVPSLVRSGLTTVSGLALGVDTAVARETMTAGGKTIAVLGNGLAAIYPPRNAELAKRIIERGGLLLSEFPFDAIPGKHTFPARNRIIAGLCTSTLVCEAPEESGSIITAELALEYNRDVFAVPGQIFDGNFAGCNRLIAKGCAKLVQTPEDVLQELGVLARSSEALPYVSGNSLEESVYRALTAMPQTMDDLIGRTQLDSSQISVALTMMELAGAAKNVGSGQWVKA